MSEAVRGKGSKFFLGADDTTPIVKTDYITRVKSIGAYTSEYNLIDVEAELDATHEEVMPGLWKKLSIDVAGNFRVGTEENKGFKAMQAAHAAQKRVLFGVSRPSGLDGFGGMCYVNKLEVSEATNEGVMTWTAQVTTTGEVTKFVEPTELV